MSDAGLDIAPFSDTERIILNLSDPKSNSDPNSKHPVLGDLKVRQAIQYAINKKVIVDKLLYGKTTVASSVVPIGWAATATTPSDFDLSKAKQLLDDAGWKLGSDGIRAKDGVRMHLIFGTTSGDKLRELTQQLIQEQLKAAGIEIEIKNVPSKVLFGSWDEKSDRKRGTFDMLMWTTGPGIDPGNHLRSYFSSKSIRKSPTKVQAQTTRAGKMLTWTRQWKMGIKPLTQPNVRLTMPPWSKRLTTSYLKSCCITV